MWRKAQHSRLSRPPHPNQIQCDEGLKRSAEVHYRQGTSSGAGQSLPALHQLYQQTRQVLIAHQEQPNDEVHLLEIVVLVKWVEAQAL